MKRILEKTVQLFNPPSLLEGQDATRYLREFLLSSKKCEIHPILLYARWRHMWYGLFPLWLDAEAGKLKIIIVNSVAEEPGLLGSATGLLDCEQISRLREMVASTRSRRILVLMHHAICRWQGKPGDGRGMKVPLQRWGLLSHDSKESKEILGILEREASPTVETVLLCAGHRHNAAHAGPVLVETSSGYEQWSKRLRIVESPSLPDVELDGSPNSARAHIIACCRLADGSLIPYRSTLAAAFQNKRPAK